LSWWNSPIGPTREAAATPFIPHYRTDMTRHPPSPPTGDYDRYADHPRYGKRPRVTGNNPAEDFDAVYLHSHNGPFYGDDSVPGHWHGFPRWFWDDGTRTVPDTAIAADLDAQTPATVGVTHYFDLDKVCRDCRRRFLFFAEEQKHWYEELRLPLEADAVRCCDCRRTVRETKVMHRRYEELVALTERSAEQSLQAAELYLELAEAAVFGHERLERVRGLLNEARDELGATEKFGTVTVRLGQLEV